MFISKEEFFKRKNKDKLYQIYRDDINTAYELSENYDSNLKTIRALKDKYRTTDHIWEMLDRVENDCGSNYEMFAYCRCQQLKVKDFDITPIEYEIVHTNIIRLSQAIGKMKQVIDFITYLEANELTLRAK